MEDQFVTLAVLNYTRAEMLKGRLEASGIDAIVENAHAITPFFPEGVKVRINLADVEAALPIAMHFSKELVISSEQAEMLAEDVSLILVPIDFSQASYNAFEYAFHLAQRLGAVLHLVHVYYDAAVAPVAAVDSYAYHIGLDVDLLEIEQIAKEEMEKFIAHFDEKLNFLENNVKISYSLLGGVIEDVLLEQAREQKADLIVLGTKGVADANGGFLGSISSYLIEHAPLPVMAVPFAATFSELPTPVSVMYITNFEDVDYLSIRKLMRLMYVFDVRIHCVHVKLPEDDQWDEIRMESLREHLRDEYGGFEFTSQIVEKDSMLVGIDAALASGNFDFIAFTAQKRDLLDELFDESLAEQLMHHTRKPFFTFHVA